MTTHEYHHQTVMLEPVVAALAVRAGGNYLDLTCGRGGHSAALLALGNRRMRVFAMDRDRTAVAAVAARFREDARFRVRHGRFSEVGAYALEQSLSGKVDGILLDLGISSPQIDDPERGFSFLRDGPLDMRMDQAGGETVAEWLHRVEPGELARVLWQFGEERWAKKIAAAIDRQRRRAPITRTTQLTELIEAVVPIRERKKNPATRTFQALRIYINDELGELAATLPQLPELLRPGGRLVVLSFHSLEDRMVKQFMAGLCQRRQAPPDAPLRDWELGEASFIKIRQRKKPLTAEVDSNPRSRSAILRVVEKAVLPVGERAAGQEGASRDGQFHHGLKAAGHAQGLPGYFAWSLA